MSMQYCQYPPAGSSITIPPGGLPVTFAPNANGLTVNQAVTTTAATFVPPANAVGFVMESDSATGNNVRWALGGAASSTAGMLMEPGRDSDYIPTATTISVCALSGTQNVVVTWVIK